MPLDNTPLVRDMFDKGKLQSEYPRILKITVRDTQAGGVVANTLVIAAGAVRFGIDGDSLLEDGFNEGSEEAEVDEGERRTMLLAARLEVPFSLQQVASATLAGATGFAGLGNAALTTSEDNAGAAVDNAEADLIVPNFFGTDHDRDLWLRSDVVAELSDVGHGSGHKNQINRLGFQTWAAMAITDSGKK